MSIIFLFLTVHTCDYHIDPCFWQVLERYVHHIFITHSLYIHFLYQLSHASKNIIFYCSQSIHMIPDSTLTFTTTLCEDNSGWPQPTTGYFSVSFQVQLHFSYQTSIIQFHICSIKSCIIQAYYIIITIILSSNSKRFTCYHHPLHLRWHWTISGSHIITHVI